MAETQSATDCVQTPELHLSATEEDSVSPSVNSHVWTPPCFSSGLLSVISTCCIGLVSGAAGGLLLGATTVVLLQSLELLAENKLLMDQLGNYMRRNHGLFESLARRPMPQRDDPMFNTYISALLEMFGVFNLSVSLSVGICIGLSTYALVIRKHGEAAKGKALGLAGPVCLMVVTATGCLLGLTLERFLSIISSFNMSYLVTISAALMPACCFISVYIFLVCRSRFWFMTWLLIPLAVYIMFVVTVHVKTKLCLMLFSIIPIVAVKKYDLQLSVAPVPLMLIITDIFNYAGHPIVTLPSLSSNHTVVLEGIFVGVLTSQQFRVAVGMSLFVSWQEGGAGKICLVAAGCGSAVLTALKAALPVIGPGPTIAALMGVAGAVGVSLAAAGASTDQYGQVGRCGLIVGAAIGAFLSSSVHSGLSGTFMGLCAASIAAGVHLKSLPLFLDRHPMWKKCFYIIVTIIILIWMYFTCTMVFVLFIKYLCIYLILIVSVVSIIYAIIRCPCKSRKLRLQPHQRLI